MIPAGYRVVEDGTIIGKRGNPLQPRTNEGGYATVSLYCNGKKVTRLVHQLVCEAFHGPKPFPEAQVRHRDGERLNNWAENLTWGTAAENWEDRRRHGMDNCGEWNGLAKLTWEQVREIRTRYAAGGVTQTELAAEYGVTPSNLGPILTGETWIDPEYVPSAADMRLRGAQHRSAKLTEQDVLDIRARYSTGNIRMQDLATKYGVTKKTISVIVNRKKWTHI
jgi:DNA-binding MarR family transcriptional regulator